MYNKRWEEGFNEQFSYCFNVGVVPDDMTMERIKNFISALLEQKETEIRKETIEAVLNNFDKFNLISRLTEEECPGFQIDFFPARRSIKDLAKEKYNIDL